MRIPCPHCGPRDVREFSYLGDAAPTRPDPAAPDADAKFVAYVYRRENPCGPHREHWYHGHGCQAFLVVHRDVRSHAVIGVQAHRSPSRPPDPQSPIGGAQA